tara:strand:+ start:208 stop:789 length:582 start_codon:yes stop_codon:yes gene_type:complete
MSFKRNLYPKGKSKNNFVHGGREINLREEFDEFVFGDGNSMPHGRKILLRRMRRDDKNNLVKCPCTDSVTQEPGTEESCPYCHGEGFFWDETWATGYAVYVGADGGQARRIRGLPAGTVRADYRIFYLRYDTEISYRDKIVDIKLDVEGAPVVPYARESIYKPSTIVRYRSDYGRIEYIAVYCYESDAIRVDE